MGNHLLLFMVVADSDKRHEEVGEYLLVAGILLCCSRIQVYYLLL